MLRRSRCIQIFLLNSGRMRIYRNLLLGLEVYEMKQAFVRRFSHNANLSIEVDRRIRNVWCSFRTYTLELYERSSAPLDLKIRLLRAEVLETML